MKKVSEELQLQRHLMVSSVTKILFDILPLNDR